jgi:hypothetical protein
MRSKRPRRGPLRPGKTPNKVIAAEYKTALPDEKTLVAEVERTRRMLEERAAVKTGR